MGFSDLVAVATINSGKFRFFVVELYEGDFLVKTKTFCATLEGLYEAIRYILSLEGKGKYKLTTVFKVLSTRGGMSKISETRYVKWYYLP
jgi:hypothetical protein